MLEGAIWGGDAHGDLAVVGMHGLGGIAGDFEPLGGQLAKEGILTTAWNLRGQGADPVQKRRGRFLDVDGHLEDFEDFMDHLTAVNGVKRFVVAGESMGALLAIRAAAERGVRERLEGAILFVPVVGLARKNPKWLTDSVRWLAKQVPGLRMRPSWFVHGRGGTPRLTRDPERQKEFEEAPHRLGPVSLQFLERMGDLIEGIGEFAPEVKCPVAVFSGGRDVFVSPEQIAGFTERLGGSSKQRFHYPESCHRLLYDYDAVEVLKDAVEWVTGLERVKEICVDPA